MFVFSRRAIQSCLDRLESALSDSQCRELAERLNRPGPGRLPAMWEVVFLRALIAVGPLRHEAVLSNGRRPDFELMIRNGETQLHLVGDITTVSDAGLDEKNPVETLSNEIDRLAKKYKLNPNHFRYQVGGGRVGEYRKARMKLFLPERSQLLQVIKEYVEPFIKGLTESRGSRSSYEHKADDAVFTISYDETQMFAGGGHVAYNVAASLIKNPLVNALRPKAQQLSAAPEGAIRLVILCDGGSGILGALPLYLRTRHLWAGRYRS
jgi:hypothetical protein